MNRFELLQLLLELNSKQLEPCLQTVNTMALQLSSTIEEILRAVDKSENAAATIITFDTEKKESIQRLNLLSSDETHKKTSKLIRDLSSQKEKLGQLGQTIQTHVLDFMGLLSLEDVISQRMRHTLSNMEQAGRKILEASNAQSLDEAKIKLEELTQHMQKSFTMTAEKESFKNYFDIA